MSAGMDAILPTKWVDRDAFTVEEAGEILGLSRPSAFAAAKKGEIPTLRIGRRLIVPRVQLERMLTEGNSSRTITDAADCVTHNDVAISAAANKPRRGYKAQMKFTLPDAFRVDLELAAQKHQISFSEEIRQRVEKSFHESKSGISRPASLTLIRTVRALLRQIEDALDATSEAESAGK